MSQDRFLYRVAADLLKRFGNELQDVAVVFNNKRPQLFLKKYLAEISGRPIWSPQLLTIQQFFSRSANLVQASPLKQFFVLLMEYNAILRKEGRPEVSADVFYPLAEIIVSDFSQIDYYLAEPAKVFNLIGSIAELQQQFPNFDDDQLEFMKSFWSSFSPERQSDVQQKFIEMWHRMPELYKNFHERLKDQGLVTSARMYRNLAEDADAGMSFVREFKHLAFVGFNALSKAEEKLFRRWQDEGLASFYFDADQHYFESPVQEAGHFIRRNLHQVGLINRFEEFGSRINDPNKDFTVIRTLGKVAQGKLLYAIIENPTGEEADSKAIILADESLLLPVLQTIPGDNLNITMGFPLEQSAVYGLCDLWLNIQEDLLTGQEKVSYNLVLKYINNPLVAPEKRLRNQLYSQITEQKKAAFITTELRTIDKFAGLTFQTQRSASAMIRNLGSLLLLVSESREELRKLESLLIAEVVKALNQLLDNFEELESQETTTELDPLFVIRTIRRSLAGLTVPFEGEPLSGLQVMGLLESRCLDFEEIIFVGMNEGILPKVSVTPSFIPDNVRRAFGLPVLENQNAIFSYFFYRLLHCARKVTLVYNSIVDDKGGSGGEASRFIRQLEFETDCRFSYVEHQHQAIELSRNVPIVIEKTGAVWDKLSRFLQRASDPKFEKRVSASAFTDYISCSLKFFFARVAGLKEPADLPDQIGANLVGTMLHSVMESFYSEAVGGEVTTSYIREREKRLPEMTLSALALALNREASPPEEAVQQIILRVIHEYALKIIRHDETLTPFSIIELENRDDYMPLFPVDVEGREEHIRLMGIIDRVDRVNGKIRIVDYKTGKDTLKFRDFEGLFQEEGKANNKALLQTLFYTYVYEQARQVRGVEPNLYTVRDFKSGTLFFEKSRSGQISLEDEFLADFKARFELRMRDKLNELFDRSLPFRQTANRDTCTYCPFKAICRR